MDRKTFLGAAVVTPVMIAPGIYEVREGTRATPERDSVTFLLMVGNRVTEYSFFIDEHSTNLMGMFRAMCVAAEGEFVSRVVLPRTTA